MNKYYKIYICLFVIIGIIFSFIYYKHSSLREGFIPAINKHVRPIIRNYRLKYNKLSDSSLNKINVFAKKIGLK
jgi:hypothetical protein